MIRGVGALGSGDDHDEGKPQTKSGAEPVKASKRKREASRDGGVGSALRSVYIETVNEKIPDEFLDLLSKLD
jgi:hypothetical protein